MMLATGRFLELTAFVQFGNRQELVLAWVFGSLVDHLGCDQIACVDYFVLPNAVLCYC
jgi:hypothetical protein